MNLKFNTALLLNYFGTKVPLSGPLRQTKGTFRSASFDQTLKKISRSIDKLNISRIIDLTPLDKIGFPTYTICRPDPSFENYSCGKGINSKAAMVSSLMEAYEYHTRYGLEKNMATDKTKRGIGKIGKYLAPEKLNLPIEFKTHSKARFDWVQAIELFSQEKIYLPADVMTLRHYSHPGITPVNPFQSTNGTASGNCIYEAIIHSIFEIIERDALVLSNFAPPVAVEFRASDFPTEISRLVKKILNCNIKVFAFDITSDLQVPSYQIYLAEQSGPDSFFIHSGQGTHLNSHIAFSRALNEACQVRLTYFSGSREDVGDGTEPLASMENLEQYHAEAAKKKYQLSTVNKEIKTFEQLLTFLLNILWKGNLKKVFVSNNSLDEVGLASISCYVPKMEGLRHDAEGNLYVGKRAKKLIKKHGLRSIGF